MMSRAPYRAVAGDDGQAPQPSREAFPITLTPAVFIKPHSLQAPEAWAEHIPFAFWLMDALKPSTFVELGTHSGNSYFAFCQAAKELGLGTQCYAVDTWRGDDHAGRYGEEIFASVTRHHDRHYKSFSRLVRSTFDQALEGFEDNTIDLLHIDGLHTYEGVRHDFESWFPKLTANAIVLFHDTNVRDRGFGVFKLWQELAARYPSLEFLHSNGLGVLSISSSPPDALRDFFSAGANKLATARVRDIFSGLGQVVSAQLIIERENSIRAEERDRLATLTVHHGAAMQRADALAAEARALGARAEAANAELFALRATYEQTVAALEAHSTELIKAQQQLAGLSQEASHAQARLAESQARNSDLADRLFREEVRRDGLGASRASLVAALADELAVSTEDARAQKAELAAMGARLNAPRWIARQFVRATRNRLAEKFQKKRVARLALNLSSQSGPPANDLKKLVAGSGLFDEAYYLSQCAEDKSAQADAIGHYLEIGAAQGKDPNPFFDTSWCMETHADLTANNINPLVHYILYGSAEGRSTSPEFDAGFYLRTHADVATAGLEPLRHFLENGRFEGRLAAPAGQRQDGSSFFPISSSSKIGLVVERNAGGKQGTLLSALLTAEQSGAVAGDDRKVDVVIPVYAGLEETRRCIESVLRHRTENRFFGTLILVDDCGPEPLLRKLLGEIASRERDVVLLVNESNLGFVKSVNRAMRQSSRDVVLLNADTEVHGNWLDRLSGHAFSNPSVATVTAFSNNATICTFPEIGGAATLPFGRALQQIDMAFASANSQRAVDVPTGVGFCMFLSRKSLGDVGLFDEAFGKGYGEENDFCQKALRAGWRNLLAGDVFVFHHGSVSFGASAAAEQLTGGAIMRERYPDYEPSVGRWIAKDPARSIRFAALASLFSGDALPVLLHILHPWGGGTEKQVAEIAHNWSEHARHLVLITRRREVGVSLDLLVPDGNSWRRYEFDFDDLLTAAPLLKSFGVRRVHVHHALEVMEELPAFLGALSVPYDFSVHDYSLICPRNNLITKGQYCGEPDNQGCLSCLRQEPAPRSRDIVLWRHNGIGILERADRVICPTVDVAERIRRYAPEAAVVAVPHEPDLYHSQRPFLPSTLRPGERMRITAIGIFAEHKGGIFLLECVERARAQGLPIDWTVVGWFPGALAERARSLKDVLTVTGPYSAHDVAGLIHDADPHLIFFPQHCAETYSYTLSEALASGRAILAPDLGAFPERISGIDGCWAYDVNLSATEVLQRVETLRTRVFVAGNSVGVPTYVDERPKNISVDISFFARSYLKS